MCASRASRSSRAFGTPTGRWFVDIGTMCTTCFMLAGCIQFCFNLSHPKSVADVNGASEKHSYSHTDIVKTILLNRRKVPTKQGSSRRLSPKHQPLCRQSGNALSDPDRRTLVTGYRNKRPETCAPWSVDHVMLRWHVAAKHDQTWSVRTAVQYI